MRKHKPIYKNRKYASTLPTEMHERYRQYQDGARARGINFNLSEKQFISLWRADCIYCGNKIDTIGIDRLDSELDYNFDNVVPCCAKCNKFKLINPPEEYVKHCEKIVNHFRIEDIAKWKEKLLRT